MELSALPRPAPRPSEAPRDAVLVLHVEDNPGDRQLIREAIGEAHVDIEVVHAGNGADALGFLTYATTRRLPTLIMVDLNMPKIGGLEFLASVKVDERWKDIPAIVLSSSLSATDHDQALSLGAKAFIPKPTSWDRYLDLARNIASYAVLTDHPG
ncbi:MAG: response regulator [Planctomycetes bacterium]|nr:response regulator [Planctomycetota bacterium]